MFHFTRKHQQAGSVHRKYHPNSSAILFPVRCLKLSHEFFTAHLQSIQWPQLIIQLAGKGLTITRGLCQINYLLDKVSISVGN